MIIHVECVGCKEQSRYVQVRLSKSGFSPYWPQDTHLCLINFFEHVPHLQELYRTMIWEPLKRNLYSTTQPSAPRLTQLHSYPLGCSGCHLVDHTIVNFFLWPHRKIYAMDIKSPLMPASQEKDTLIQAMLNQHSRINQSRQGV